MHPSASGKARAPLATQQRNAQALSRVIYSFGLCAGTPGGAGEDKYVDLHQAGSYLPAIQVLVSTTAASGFSVLVNWLVPVGAISAIRTLAMTAVVALVFMRRPIIIGKAKGVTILFAALRPASVIYVGSLVMEQLVSTCVGGGPSPNDHILRLIFHVNMTVLTVTAFVQVLAPTKVSDVAVCVAALVLVAAALIPPPNVERGPLCSPPDLMEAGDRLLRAFLYACTYVTVCYTAAPLSNSLADQMVCIMRSAAASVWVLGVHTWMLALAPVQIAVAIYRACTTDAYDAIVQKGRGERGEREALTDSPSSTPPTSVHSPPDIEDGDPLSEGFEKAQDLATLVALRSAVASGRADGRSRMYFNL